VTLEPDHLAALIAGTCYARVGSKCSRFNGTPIVWKNCVGGFDTGDEHRRKGGHQSSSTRTSAPLAICGAMYSSNENLRPRPRHRRANHQVRVVEDHRSGHSDLDGLTVCFEFLADTAARSGRAG
jgi:hypothetical protein